MKPTNRINTTQTRRWLVAALAFGLTVSAQAKTIKVPSGSIQTIQDGVNAAGPGDTVKVSPGTYASVVIPKTKPGLKLTTQGRPGSVKLVGTGGTGTGIEISADHVTVDGFDITGFEGGILATRWNPEDLLRNVKIANNTVTACSTTGIWVANCTGGDVENNVIEGTIGWGGGIVLSASSAVRVHHNETTNHEAGAGMEVNGGSNNCEIDHNTVAGNAGNGIFLNTGSTSIQIHHNEITSNAASGITLWQSPDCTLSYNESNANGNFGISVAADSEGSTVENNTCNANLLGGIYVGIGGCSFSNNSAFGNTGLGDLVDGPAYWGPGVLPLNVFQNNSAGTAFPSLVWWDAN